MNDNTGYVIVSSAGTFFDGIHNNESVVWLNNLQSVEPYVNYEFAHVNLPLAQNEKFWRGDADARIYTVTRDDKGYLHLGSEAMTRGTDASTEQAWQITEPAMATIIEHIEELRKQLAERDARITELGKTVESARRLTTLCNKRVKELEDALASLCETCENLRLNLLDVQTS